MRVLVIGGTGFIGAPTVRRLLANGHEVAAFHRGITATQPPAGAHSIVGERESLVHPDQRLRLWRPDTVVDFIAFTGTHVERVLRAVRGTAQRLVVLSSLDVYRAYDRLLRHASGPPEPLPLREDAPLRETSFPRRRLGSSPDDPMWEYDKIPVERAARSDPEVRGTILRLPAVFGPGDRTRHRVGQYLRRMREGDGTLDLDRSLSGWRWTRGYVEDVAEAIAAAAVDPRASERTYNVGESTPLTEGEWVRAIARVAGYSGEIAEVPREKLPPSVASALGAYDFAQDLVLETTSIRAELGWLPREDPDEALAASIAWERAT